MPKSNADAKANTFPSFTRQVSTKVEGEQLLRTVTIEYPGLNEEQMSELASRSVIIGWQAAFKKHGAARWPAQEPVKIIAQMGSRVFVDAKTRAINALDSMSEDEVAKVLDLYRDRA
ncbi:hypothetical protein LCGC14_2100980 [marine sediment metagenome]|uniref:Uncharacterized protein n=1 Tax=marine sediment metagenome TaxID=412755 RepID=A0A0F9GN47_9ZZZZ